MDCKDCLLKEQELIKLLEENSKLKSLIIARIGKDELDKIIR